MSRLIAKPLYRQTFDTDEDGWIYVYRADAQNSPMLHATDEDGNGYIYSQGPWWIDPNHSAPGAGYLNLLAVQYAEPANISEFTDLSLSLAISVENLVLPQGAELYLWFQATDQAIAWGNGNRVNYANIANPLSPLLGTSGEATVTINFRAVEEDWLALGTSLQIDESYSTSASIEEALAAVAIDFGIIALLGNDVPPVSAGGTVRIDDVQIARDGPLRAQVFLGDADEAQLLNLAVELSEADGETFQGYVLRLIPEAGAASILAFADEPEFGLLGMDGVIYLDGEPVAQVVGGEAGAALSISVAAPLDAAAMSLLISRLALIPAADDVGAQPLTLTLEDGNGNISSLDVVVRVRPPLYEGAGSDLVEGTNSDDGLRGGDGNDTLLGLGGNDRLFGGSGDDRLVGGFGDDLHFVDDPGDDVVEWDGEGRDIVFASTSYVVADDAFVEVLSAASQADFAQMDLVGNKLANLIVGNAGTNALRGGDGDDWLDGLGGDDTLIGDAGADTLVGGEGDDRYFVDIEDRVVERAKDGRDTVHTGASYRLPEDVHVELISAAIETATDPIDLTGNALDQAIVGNAGANTLRGGGGDDRLDGLEGNDSLIGDAGADTLAGGGGDDLYFVDPNDIVVEYAGEGRDIVYAATHYRLESDVPVELISAALQAATDALNLTGNAFDQVMVGNAGTNTLRGGGGDDWLDGLGGDDSLIGDDGDDTLVGGQGDDQHFVDTGDRVVERENEGRDIAYAVASYRLPEDAHVELISAALQAATDPIDLTGNALAQLIVGNAGANTLRGGGGDDRLDSLDGDDSLIGDAGSDKLVGGRGDDTYFVDDADLVVERAGEGRDIVYAGASFRLAEDVHVELLSTMLQAATSAIDLTGNAFDQLIVGNAGTNSLRGGAGDDWLEGLGGNDSLIGDSGTDTLVGGQGDDSYFVDADDKVVERANEGRDIVYADVSYRLAADLHVEVLSTAAEAGTGAIDLTGNAFDQLIVGNAGANALDGGVGADILVGLGGADRFVFSSALGAGNVDLIGGFQSGADEIALHVSVFAGLGLGSLAAGAFAVGTAAADADDRIVYDRATGALFFDADGSGDGTAIQFARLSGNPELAVGDFIVI